jgi:hypothetical protein
MEAETEHEMSEDKISQTKQVRKSEIPFTPSPDANQTRHLTWPVLQSAATQPWGRIGLDLAALLQSQ